MDDSECGFHVLGAETVPGLDVASVTPEERARWDAEAKERKRLSDLASARGWPFDPYATMAMLKTMSETNPPPRPAVSPTPMSYYVPAAASYTAARSCGAVGMTWAHFLAIAIFIMCLVAVQYGVRHYKKKAA